MRSEDIANLDLKALYDLEQQLSISLSHIRSRKVGTLAPVDCDLKHSLMGLNFMQC